MSRRRVGILVFPDVEVLDFCGPFEVFATTRLDGHAELSPVTAAGWCRSS